MSKYLAELHKEVFIIELDISSALRNNTSIEEDKETAYEMLDICRKYLDDDVLQEQISLKRKMLDNEYYIYPYRMARIVVPKENNEKQYARDDIVIDMRVSYRDSNITECEKDKLCRIFSFFYDYNYDKLRSKMMY